MGNRHRGLQHSSIVQLPDALAHIENIIMALRKNGTKDNSVSAKHY